MRNLMKKIILLACCSVVFGGCVAMQRQAGELDNLLEPTVVFHSSDGSSILSCLNDIGTLRSREFNRYFRAAESGIKRGRDEDKLRFICLSLNDKASYRQFKEGVAMLKQYIKEHPDSREELSGLMGLVVRLDRAKVNRWSGRKKMLDEKEELEAEVASLQARVEALLREHEQDAIKIQELRNQIEQLKNIENIIKNREHGS